MQVHDGPPGKGRIDFRLPVGASLLAKNLSATRYPKMGALSLTFFASKLAPTKNTDRLRPVFSVKHCHCA
ncbi:hypothetical protein DK871_14375 [Pseudomonas sp. L13]|nr:hypothetical protein [Pseudomonas sp. L13]